MTPQATDHFVAVRWRIPFFLLATFFLFQYTLIHDRLGLAPFRLMFVLVVVLGLALLADIWRVDFSDTQTRAWLAFLGLMCFHVAFARNNMAAFGAAKTVLPYFVVYLAMLTFACTLGRVTTLAWIWVFAYAYLAVNVIANGGTGVGAYFADENDAALTLNMGFPLVYFLAAGTCSIPRKLLLWSVLGIMVAALVATGSRGGFLGFMAVLVFLVLASRHRVRGLAAAAVIFGVLVTFAPDSYLERVRTIGEYQEEDTAQDRIYMWKKAWLIFLDYPLVGIGGYNFAYRVSAYEPEDPLFGFLRGGRQVHSLYFTLLPELGLAGTILFGVLVWATFRDLRRVVRQGRAGPARLVTDGGSGREARAADATYYLAMGLTGGLIGFLVSATFLSVLYYPQFWSLMALSVALKRASEGMDAALVPLARASRVARGGAGRALRFTA